MIGPLRRDDGYATFAAVLASACFALLAAQIVRTARSGVVSVNAASVHGRLEADADAGLAIALDHVLADDPVLRWSIDGRAYAAPFADADLQIQVEDEAGKIPLNRLTQTQAEAMFRLAGADPVQISDLTREFMDWRNPNLRESAAGRAATARPPSGQGVSGFATVYELMRLPGVTPAMYAAIAPFATVDAGDVSFELSTASPFALKVMGGGDAPNVASIERQREAEGERTAFDVSKPPIELAGRVVTVRVRATDSRGDRADNATIVQITKSPRNPYIVRQHLS